MNDKVKVIIAVVCLAGAGLFIAMQFGVFGGDAPVGADNDGDDNVEWTEQQGEVRMGETEQGRPVQSLGSGGSVRID